VTDFSPRLPFRRWVGATTAAETIGMTAAATAAVIAARVDSVAAGLAIVVAGGLVEGLALALFTAGVLRRWRPSVRSAWWVTATIIVAGLGWAGASAPAALAGDGDGTEPPLALVLAGAAALGLVLGALLGLVQAPALRGAVAHPWRWVGVSAAAWTPTMVVMFLGATLPDATWSPTAIILTGVATGVLAGALLGVVSAVVSPVLEGSRVSREVVVGILESPAHGLLSGSLVGLRVRGRRTGRVLRFPVAFRRDGDDLLVTPGWSQRKRWWRNLVGGARVEVLAAGVWRSAWATVEPGEPDPTVRLRLEDDESVRGSVGPGPLGT
jgi:hypothetical protein